MARKNKKCHRCHRVREFPYLETFDERNNPMQWWKTAVANFAWWLDWTPGYKLATWLGAYKPAKWDDNVWDGS